MFIARSVPPIALAVLVAALPGSSVWAQDANVGDNAARASISVEIRSIETYPFSDPNPVPILASDTRLYPYHRFEGYAHASEPRDWTVVHLENEWIEVWVLPEIGGKVWGARVKETGHEFIYRNEVLKFRNIALRGPWTSGGIEFNFGVIGHTPSTASPVDWVTEEHDDGSVAVTVGAMDLPSRTNWRVEVRLPADRAYFETNVLWQNPTTLEQPYYTWMTGAAFAQDDLIMAIPGNAFLEHPGAEREWPIDPDGRELPVYDQNRFGGNKSYHVVGELNDYFGGYYLQADYGFGHWARYDEMPGQKLWLWALSRQGGIWEDLLTDTDGQYVEFQAGRLLVQYSPDEDVNPISQVGFEPGATDRWSETWFPVEQLGGLTDASRDGAMFVEAEEGTLRVRAHAFGAISDTLRITVDGAEVSNESIDFTPLDPVVRDFGVGAAFGHTAAIPDQAEIVVELRRLGLIWHSDPRVLALDRPFATDVEAMPNISGTDRAVMAARELVQGRRLEAARELFVGVLQDEPWNRDALLGLADLESRRGRYDEGLAHARRALELDAYDAEANFVAGTLYRALNRDIDAVEAFGWSARSMAFRSISYVQLAELALRGDDVPDAARYAELALDYDRYSLSALEVLAIVGRLSGDAELAAVTKDEILRIDPLHHFVRAETFLDAGGSLQSATGRTMVEALRGEYPGEELLEAGIRYASRGRTDDAVAVLRAAELGHDHLVAGTWAAWLMDAPATLPAEPDVAFHFPYRPESIAVLRWAADTSEYWGWDYLLALNLWARDRAPEALQIVTSLEAVPDFGAFYVARAALAGLLENGSVSSGVDREADLRRAVELAGDERVIRVPLIQLLQAEGRWEDALEVSGTARAAFPGDFDLDLLHAAALVETSSHEDAISVLDDIAVLPSEHSSTSHGIFAAAHTQAGLSALEQGSPDEAASHFETAMTWPERLGLGRPYEPEERLQRYLLGVALAASGDGTGATAAFEAVVESTRAVASEGGRASRDDLPAILALVALQRRDEVLGFGNRREGAIGRIITSVRQSSAPDGDVDGALQRTLEGAPELFADSEGRLLYRALMLER